VSRAVQQRRRAQVTDVLLSDCRAVATLSRFESYGWVRGERGVEAGCGVTRWAVRLGRDDGGTVFVLGVASDRFFRLQRLHSSQCGAFVGV